MHICWFSVDIYIKFVCLFVLGAGVQPIYPKTIFTFLGLFLCWGLMSAPRKVSTDFTLTTLPSNSNWMCRVVIFVRCSNLAFYAQTIVTHICAITVKGSLYGKVIWYSSEPILQPMPPYLYIGHVPPQQVFFCIATYNHILQCYMLLTNLPVLWCKR